MATQIERTIMNDPAAASHPGQIELKDHITAAYALSETQVTSLRLLLLNRSNHDEYQKKEIQILHNTSSTKEHREIALANIMIRARFSEKDQLLLGKRP
jgi:hypothetical protein